MASGLAAQPPRLAPCPTHRYPFTGSEPSCLPNMGRRGLAPHRVVGGPEGFQRFTEGAAQPSTLTEAVGTVEQEGPEDDVAGTLRPGWSPQGRLALLLGSD